MQRRTFLKQTTLGLTAAALPGAAGKAGAEPAPGKPNIVFIVSDQHRTGLTKREGYALDTSPTLDRLATEGVAFDRAYCTSPLCVPSRTSMLTGRWPDAHRVKTNDELEFAFFEDHLYSVAKKNGYRTGLSGKNHTFIKPADLDFFHRYDLAEGYMPPDPPREYIEFEKWMRSLHANIALEPTPFPLECQFPYRIVSDAIEFIDSSAGQPFILQVGFSEPHDPEQAPAPYWNMFPPESIPDRCAGPEALKQLGYRAQWEYGHQENGFPTEKNWRRYKSNYLGMLRFIDDQLLRLVNHLKEKGLYENTVFVYLADHGDFLMDYGLGRKGVGLAECLTRIPMVWFGGPIKPSQVGATACTSIADVMPTLCEAMGAAIPHGVQGRSLWPLLRAEKKDSEEFRSAYVTVGVGGLYYEASDNVPFGEPGRAPGMGFDELNKVTMSGMQKMVRMGDWKLIYDFMGYGQLYNIVQDPCELKNLFNEPAHAAEQARLMAELCMWVIRSQDPLPVGPQGKKYSTKWATGEHNWLTPFRHGSAPTPYIP